MTLRWSITCSVNRKVSTLAQDLNDGGEQGTFLEFVQTDLFPNTFPRDSGRFGLKIYSCCLSSLNGEIKRLRTKLPQPSPKDNIFWPQTFQSYIQTFHLCSISKCTQNHFRFLPHDMIVGRAGLMSDTLHALGWLLVMDCTRGEVAYDHGGWINDSNHVRRHQAALYDDVSEWVGEVTLLDQGWHHCERAKVAIWGPPSHIWATCYHQINYGAKHEVRLYFGRV